MASLSAQINVSVLTLLPHFPGYFHWLGTEKTQGLGPRKLLAHLRPCLMKNVVYILRLAETGTNCESRDILVTCWTTRDIARERMTLQNLSVSFVLESCSAEKRQSSLPTNSKLKML